jgi:hypothetical protein
MTTRRPNAYTQSLQETQRRAEEQPGEQPDSKPENTLERKTEKQEDSKTARQKNVKTLRQKDSQTGERIKATFYLQPEDILTIDEVQMQRFRTTGNKPLRSEVVSEAIKLLGQQNSLMAEQDNR